jgi:hypothetical protein
MAFNGSGVFTRLYNWANDAAASIKIRADRFDAEMDGFATGLSTCMTKDGQQLPTAAQNFNGQNLTNVGVFGATGQATFASNVLTGRTSLVSYNSGVAGSALNAAGQGIFECDYATGPGITQNIFGAGANNVNNIYFYRNNIAAGVIVTNSSAQTSYAASSDYRLKVMPHTLTGSGAFIDALCPKKWVWASSGEQGVGFIAHEVAEVSPTSVFGAKDAVDENGDPVYQSMEYGSPEFIANIVAELKSLRARVATLEAKA